VPSEPFVFARHPSHDECIDRAEFLTKLGGIEPSIVSHPPSEGAISFSSRNRASLPSDIIAFVVLCRLRYRLTLRDLSRLHDDGGCAACLPLRAGYAQSIAFRVPNSVAWAFRHAGNCSLTKPFPSTDDYPSDHHGTLAAIPFRIIRLLCSTAARRFIRQTPRR
jgi:hypothetical protein